MYKLIRRRGMLAINCYGENARGSPVVSSHPRHCVIKKKKALACHQLLRRRKLSAQGAANDSVILDCLGVVITTRVIMFAATSYQGNQLSFESRAKKSMRSFVREVSIKLYNVVHRDKQHHVDWGIAFISNGFVYIFCT